MSTSTAKRPVKHSFALIFYICLGTSALIIISKSTISISSLDSSSFRRQLLFRDSLKFSFLQSYSDVDPSIELRAQNDPDETCTNIFLYLPSMFEDHGHGSQINNYLTAVITSTFIGRPMVVLEPPIERSKYPGGSQFGCPVDAFKENFSQRQGASWEIKEDFPAGFSRLIKHPSWLSHGCSVPCADKFDYAQWIKLANRYKDGDFSEIHCKNLDGQRVNVIATGGGKLRHFFRSHERFMIERPSKFSHDWALRLGASEPEANLFSDVVGQQKVWDFVSGLMVRSGVLQFQPWIARDVELFSHSFDLPPEGGYDSIHVRRGDKLEVEARGSVIDYWKAQGIEDENNLPSDYIPFAHYLSQWQSAECNDEINAVNHHVYVATDDPVVVKEEISKMAKAGDHTIVLDKCHTLTFHFNPTDDTVFHVIEGGNSDSCFQRYHRNIASITDLMILSKSNTFIGEFNSNWGRLLRTMRVTLDLNTGQFSENKGFQTFTKVKDTRVAWGPTTPRAPGV